MLTKHLEVERIIETISDAEWAELERITAEEEEVWWQRVKSLPPATEEEEARWYAYAQAEHEDLIEGRLDEEFWARGAW